jgi:plastocyanin
MPAVLNVHPGTQVTVTNQDPVGHTWTSDTGAWDSGTLSQGNTYSYTFTTPGTYSYHCAIHSSMKGTVNVS